MSLRRADVVLVLFPFTDLSTSKRRPALVISSDHYNTITGDLIIAQITSRVSSPARPGDHHVKDWKAAGLLLPSVVRARMATLHVALVIKVLGSMPEPEMAQIDRAIASVIGPKLRALT